MRREAEPFLKGVNIAPFFSEDDAAYVEKMLVSHKATVKTDVNKRTKVVVIGPGVTAEEIAAELKTAQDNSTPIVTEDWLVECIKAGDVLWDDVGRFSSDIKLPEEKKEEEEEVAPPPAKKAKVAEVDDAPAPAATTMDVDEAPAKYVTAAIPTNTSFGPPKTKSATKPATGAALKRAPCPLKVNTTWMGVCSSEDSHIPFYLKIESIVSGAVEGVVRWPTLKNSAMKMKGTVLGNAFQYTEYEIIHGVDEVEPGTEYTANLENEHTMSGSWELPGADMAGTFTASLLEDTAVNGMAPQLTVDAQRTAAANATSALHFQANSNYKGKCLTTNDFELVITKRDGNLIEGVVTWPALSYSSNLQGEVVGTQLKFSEISLVKAGAGATVPKFPLLYAGNLDENQQSIKGARTDLADGAATFTLNLSN